MGGGWEYNGVSVGGITEGPGGDVVIGGVTEGSGGAEAVGGVIEAVGSVGGSVDS